MARGRLRRVASSTSRSKRTNASGRRLRDSQEGGVTTALLLLSGVFLKAITSSRRVTIQWKRDSLTRCTMRDVCVAEHTLQVIINQAQALQLQAAGEGGGWGGGGGQLQAG